MFDGPKHAKINVNWRGHVEALHAHFKGYGKGPNRRQIWKSALHFRWDAHDVFVQADQTKHDFMKAFIDQWCLLNWPEKSPEKSWHLKDLLSGLTHAICYNKSIYSIVPIYGCDLHVMKQYEY